MTERYEGITHVFYSNNTDDGNIYIEPGLGQNLIINGTVAAPTAEGVDGSVQFNSLGDLAGDSTFLYDTLNNNLSIPHLKIEDIKGFKNSSALGYSTVYQGPNENFPQTINTAIVQLNNFGTDAQIARANNVIGIACPNYIYGASTGGVCVYEQSVVDDPFSEYPTALLYTNFTLEADVSSVSINETGDKIVFVDRSQLGYIYIYENILGTWTKIFDTALDARAIKYTVDGARQALLYVDSTSHFKVYDFVGPEQNLIDFSIAFDPATLNLSINKGVLAFYRLENLYIYSYNSGTLAWDLSYSYVDPLYEYKSIDVIDTLSGYTATTTNDNFLKIIENGAVTSFAGTFSYSCINSVYVFAFDGTTIKIYQKVSGTWTLLSQSYTTSGITRMTCNEEYLVCSRLVTEDALILKIVPYTEGPVLINQISMGVTESNNKLTINSMYGTEFDNNVQISGTTTTNLLNVQSAGTVSSPAINFGSSTGIYEDTNEINVCVGGVDKLVVNTNYTETGNVRIGDGTVSSPAVSFSSDLDTGIYKSAADEIAITTGGNRMMRISQADGVRMDGNLTINNDLFFGSVNNSIQNVADLYMRIDAVGGTRMTWDGVHTVSYVPYRTLHNGDVSHPAFSFIDSTNTGMYLEPGNTLSFAVDGVKVAEFNDTPNLIKTDNYYGLTTNSTGIAMTTNMRLLTNNTDRLMLGNGGNNLTTASFGDSSNLNSQNPTGGSIVKVVASGAGKWGQENVVLAGATQFHLFLATTTGVGSITTNGATTSYNTTSDYRLKENVELLTNQLERIDKLKPVKYTWKNKEINGEGFLAHELAEVFPEAVYGEKDAVDENGKIVPQGIDTTFLTGSLVACIKELRTELNAAKIEIEAMKTEMATFV